MDVDIRVSVDFGGWVSLRAIDKHGDIEDEITFAPDEAARIAKDLMLAYVLLTRDVQPPATTPTKGPDA